MNKFLFQFCINTSKFQQMRLTPNRLASILGVRLSICIWKVLGSNLGGGTDYTDLGFRRFP
jgi:hypothetical protein